MARLLERVRVVDLTAVVLGPLAPRLGGYSSKILREIGYDNDAIKALIVYGIVAVP